MTEPQITQALSPSEWQLIEAIRALPDTDQRSRTHEVLGRLLFYLRNPRCQGLGPEGFPCGEPVATCSECDQIWTLLDQVFVKVGRDQAGLRS